ncbi:hypothetical protein NON08_13455 [Cetobacterium somerae]|uniref:hypothetical protein n=1 Tax=Cetobacterium sp. NK01 TaxID=2993530 RepID=UPI00211605FC|nr:hypothetical protein [Cetobacterium sp. NK01]MCQ8213508.1 hypothetical protein [Cetobacterium sp. NK01]
MKKILICSFLLAISSFSYSSEEGYDAEATMNITATIIKPLTVQSNGPLEFGTLLPGTIGTSRSSFTIDGEKYSKVKITFDGLEPDGDNFEVPLKLDGSSNESFMVYFNCSTNSDEKVNQENKFINLTSMGKSTLHIAASTTLDADQTPGKYTGQITMRATYE